MTVVITYLASDNARNRRRAKRAAEYEKKRTVTGCRDRVARAISGPSVRDVKEVEFVTRENPKYRKVSNPYGQHINARQKMRGCSIPLI